MNWLVAIVFVGVFAAAGSVMLFSPDRLQQSALRANASKKNWPVLGHIWHESVRKPSYLVGMRIAGAAVLGVAGLLLAIIASALARGAVG